MKRRVIIGVAALAGLAGTVLVGWRQRGVVARRLGDAGAATQPRQWPFERADLAALMERVVADQRERVASLPAGPARDRAAAFLAYYQGRRAAVVG